MLFIICLLASAALLVLFIPEKIFNKKTSYDFLRVGYQPIVTKSTEFAEEKIIRKLLKVTRRLQKIIPIQMETERQLKIQSQIDQAGLQKILTPNDLLSTKILLALGSLGYFLFIFLLTADTLILGLGLLGALMAYFIPEYYVIMRSKKRKKQIVREMPGILTALAIVTDAGLNLVPAVIEVTNQNTGVFVKELSKTLDEIQIGISQTDAFQRMANRCQVDEINYFVASLIQGFEKGNSGLTKILREQAEESIQKRKFEAKALAEKASMKLFFPLLCMVFPAFMIFLIGPMFFSLIELFKLF